MLNRTAIITLVFCVAAGMLLAQESGTAKGEGKLERPGPGDSSEMLPFAPRFAYAYAEGTGAKKFTWIVLTEKQPPSAAWSGAKDRAEARRLWCEKEKTPFVAVKLDTQWKVDLYFLCPANGGVNTEMVSSWNGLESVVVAFETRSDKRLKGTLRTGTGSCPGGTEGQQVYCTKTGDYAFDTSISK